MFKIVNRWLAPAILACPALAIASNGVYTTGYGTVSSSMAGTDVALSHDISALVINPAGLAVLDRPQLDVYLTPFHTLNFGIRDGIGNDRRLDNNFGALLGGGFILPLKNHPGWVAAVGVTAQGGVGFEYRDAFTPFGNQDDLLALFGVYKFSGGLAWQASEQWRFGATIDLVHATARQLFFPDTSVADDADPQAAFFGIRVDGLASWRVGARVGLQYQPREDLTFGLAYAPRTPLPLSGGSATVNYESIGGGRVRYRDAAFDGLALPQEIGLAVAWTGIDRLLLTAEASWFEWSRAVSALTLSASDPDLEPAPADSIEQVTRIGFRNRVVISAALAYELTPRATLRAGYSYNGQIQPDETLSPIFTLIARRDYALGLSYELPPDWSLHAGLEYQPYNPRRYTNPDLPLFGDDTRSVNEGIFLHLMVSRRW